MKIEYLIITSFSLLLWACGAPEPNPAPYVPESLNSNNNNNNYSIVDINDYDAKPKGARTSQRPENMQAADLSNRIEIPPKELLAYVQQAIIPEYKNWVILKNGTYIIFDNIDTIPDVKKMAVQWLNQYKPKDTDEKNWDFSVTDLDQIEGWSVFGNGYGIYTLVLAKELSIGASPQQVGVYAKAKRALDEKNPKILYVNSVNGLEEIN